MPVLDPTITPALDEGWIRAVLFDHAIDDWVDLGPDPIRRRHAGQIYADHVGAAYAAWKWRCDAAGSDTESPPAERPVPEALALEVGVGDWTELMAALLTAGRAQGLLFAELAATGGEAARRAFDRTGRDLAGHAALAFLELRRGDFADRARAGAALARLMPATARLLAGTGVEARWQAQLTPLLAELGLRVEVR
ncbi:MAG TPA: hypothetical protein VGO87_09815 [Acidimicrobiia bacterium]